MKCFLARAKLIWAILKVLMWVLSHCFWVGLFFLGWLLRGVISGKHIGINVQRLIIAIRKMIMLIIISSNIFPSQYLLLKNIKTWSRTVLRKDGIPMSRCHFSTWINCHERQETPTDAERLPGVSTTGFQRQRGADAERLPGVSTMGFQRQRSAKGLYCNKKPLGKSSFKTPADNELVLKHN